MSTIRQQIFQKVVDQLKTISTETEYQFYGVTGNYQSNLGESVFPWRAAPATQASEYPFLVVRDIDELHKEASPGAPRVERQLHLIINIATAGDAAMDDLRNKFYPDVEIALGIGRQSRWDGLSGNTRPRLNRSVGEHESEYFAGGIVEFYIDYPTYAFYPYAVPGS
jgi:hypothetical protein